MSTIKQETVNDLCARGLLSLMNHDGSKIMLHQKEAPMKLNHDGRVYLYQGVQDGIAYYNQSIEQSMVG